MFWFNLHLDLVAWAAGGFVAGYVTCWVRTLRKITRRKKRS
jgi:hypothetical protein